MFRIKLFRAPMFQIKMYRAPNVYNQDVPSPKCVESRCTEPQMFRIKMLLAPLFLIKINRAPNGSNQDVPSPQCTKPRCSVSGCTEPQCTKPRCSVSGCTEPQCTEQKKVLCSKLQRPRPDVLGQHVQSGDSEQDQTALHSLPNKCTAR